MNNRIVNLILIVFSFCISQNVFGQKQIKIACVGNSITYGAGVDDRVNNNYPQQLQNMLGNNYQVKNFGVSGTTLLKKGNPTYWKTKAYADALAFNPDIVLIKLGTNDSKAENRPFYNEFETNYKELIQSFQKLPSHPRVVLVLPVPSLLTDSTSIYDPVIKNQIIPFIQNVAYDTHIEVIDLYHLFIDNPSLLADGIHPSSLGATIIAKRLFEVVRLKEASTFDIFKQIKEQKTITSFYGFDCIDFNYNGRNCKIVKPKKVVEGRPWIWRARFWGHEPQTDIALLERGFHLVYCDVVEWFGNSKAINTWNSFYNYMQTCGLSKKCALEGMSRGGVYIYNWAMANADKVSCIYADAPVLDLKSWPGGLGKSKGSSADWEIFKKDYNLTEQAAKQFANSPLNHAAKIAKLGIPMLHVVGDADDIVPVDENTAPFEIAVKNAGGNITVIHKPGIGHHPHSLQNPTPIVDFILRATGYKTNFAALPAPGSEYRSGAGWNPGKGWWAQHNDIDSLLITEKKLDIVFIGNSITQGIGGHRSYVTAKPGFDAFNKAFKNYNWECAGISGDKTQHVLWRLQHGKYSAANPRLIVLAIGVNNFVDDEPDEIAAGIRAILTWMKQYLPATKIVLIGPLPAGTERNDLRRKKYENIQATISKYQQKNMTYLPLGKVFIQSNGVLNPTMYSEDGIHLTSEGYEAWALALAPVIKKLLK